MDWRAAYQLSFQCTRSTKLIVFQFKLLHRRLATYDCLKKVGIKDNDLCSFCKTEKESLLIHFFWSCRIVSTFWKNFKELLVSQNLALRTYNLSLNIVLGLRPDTSKNKQKLNIIFLWGDIIYGPVGHATCPLKWNISLSFWHVTTASKLEQR